MSLPSPLISYAINGGAANTLASGASGSILTGVLLTLTLQDSTAVSSVTYSFQAPGTTLDGRTYALNAPFFSLSLELPVTPTTYTITTQVSSGTNVTSNTNYLVASAQSGSVTPVYASVLAATTPSATRQLTGTDAYASPNDGGSGTFSWATGTFTTDGGTVFVPSGFAGVGAWIKNRENTSRYNALSFGTPQDSQSDCYAKLQAILDLNTPGINGSLHLPYNIATAITTVYISGPPISVYSISQPLVINDRFPVVSPAGLAGNNCVELSGAHRKQVALAPTNLIPGNFNTPSYLGPLVIAGFFADTVPVFIAGTYGGNALTALISGTSLNDRTLTGTVSSLVGTALVGSGTTFLTDLVVGNNLSFDAEGTLWGVAAVIDNTHATLTASYSGSATGGSTIKLRQPTGYVNASQYDTGHLDGATQLTVEAFWNPMADAIATSAATTYQLMTSYGNLQDLESHTAFQITRTRVFGGAQIRAQITTTGGTVTVQTTLGTELTANVYNHIALNWNGSFVDLYLNGTRVDHQACTGTLVQKFYEEVTFGGGTFDYWPSSGGFIAPAGINFRMALPRLSIIARYSGTTITPTPASVGVCDSNTKAVIDFASANRPTRATIAAWIIGRTGATSIGGAGRSNLPVWYDLHTSVFPYTNSLKIHDIRLHNPQGIGAYLGACLQTTIDDVDVTAPQGFTFTNYSYLITVTGSCNFTGASVGGSYHSWNFFFGLGVQMVDTGPGIAASGGVNNAHIIAANGTVKMSTCFLSGFRQFAIGIMRGCSGFIADNIEIDDETGAQQYCSVLIGSNIDSASFRGGFAGAVSTKPFFKIRQVNDLHVHMSIFGQPNQPIFSFDTLKNNGKPVIFHGTNDATDVFGSGANYNQIVDPSNPGPVHYPAKENYGVNALTFASDADMTVTWNDFMWGQLTLSDGGVLTAGRNVILPTVQAGYTRKLLNTSATKTLTFKGPSGSGIAIAPTKIAILESDGTNWIRLTADA